jgi:hypothetical protein
MLEILCIHKILCTQKLRFIINGLVLFDQVHKFRIQELELSFTQGHWIYECWGGLDPISSSNLKPPGVELWGVLDVPLDQVDATWKILPHSFWSLLWFNQFLGVHY